jgi:hypothetical protein
LKRKEKRVFLRNASYTVPKIWPISVSKEEEVPYRGKFSSNSRKLVIISTDYWKIFPLGDFLPYILGNLPCFWDSVQARKGMFDIP